MSQFQALRVDLRAALPPLEGHSLWRSSSRGHALFAPRKASRAVFHRQQPEHLKFAPAPLVQSRTRRHPAYIVGYRCASRVKDLVYDMCLRLALGVVADYKSWWWL
jgi:hypothetical protein